MKPALLLIDLQADFLASADLEPSRGAVVAAAGRLLAACRLAGVPVAHVWTTVPSDEDRMPHWKAIGRRWCIPGTPGHAPPPGLAPASGECVVHKRYYSGFDGGGLENFLYDRGADTVLLAGLCLRACVRMTALDAYARGFEVWVADDAVADDDSVHAAVTRRYLDGRGVRFVAVDGICAALGAGAVGITVADGIDHACSGDGGQTRLRIPVGRDEDVRAAATTARSALGAWQDWPLPQRSELLLKVAAAVKDAGPGIARQIAVETGKPIRDARLEIGFAADLVREAVRFVNIPAGDGWSGQRWRLRRTPLGVVGVITPWNNPLAIPLGKIGPALLHGNTVVWKPAPAGASIAARALALMREVGLPAGVVTIVQGDRTTAERVAANPGVDAMTLTGSSAAGQAVGLICAARHVPFQGELGGNNPAVVWADADLRDAAQQIARAGFGAAGQRCTANRRIVVDATCHDAFLVLFTEAVANLRWGDPLDDTTDVGPLISAAAVRRVADVIERARGEGTTVITPHQSSPEHSKLMETGFYYPPTVVCCDDPRAEIVREETFGPVVVVQKAQGWDDAMRLCNGVRQGLVAALFSGSPQRQKQFLTEARAGMLKINTATAGAAADAPFGGWKASGAGPPEHGLADTEFYSRYQTIYGSDPL
jgi:acyl-CoA reductase-like NAD-dependent aldehyde dehydrogenase/isochorismate hydrolase